jgi:proteasome lid subunit RPN8/RPN11
MKDRSPPVVLEPYAFSSLLMAAVEVHSRESLGFLIGNADRQFVGGRMTECVCVNACYPVQTAVRGRTGVGFDNLAARKRAEDTVRAVGFDIVGGFHSHPNGSPKLSQEDVVVVLDELESVYSKMGLSQWIEIVVGVKRIKHPRRSVSLRKLYSRSKTPNAGFYPHNITPTISGDLLTIPDQAFRIEAACYLFADGKVDEGLLVYSRY